MLTRTFVAAALAAISLAHGSESISVSGARTRAAAGPALTPLDGGRLVRRGPVTGASAPVVRRQIKFAFWGAEEAGTLGGGAANVAPLRQVAGPKPPAHAPALAAPAARLEE
jgi:hypothetical protein